MEKYRKYILNDKGQHVLLYNVDINNTNTRLIYEKINYSPTIEVYTPIVVEENFEEIYNFNKTINFFISVEDLENNGVVLNYNDIVEYKIYGITKSYYQIKSIIDIIDNNIYWKSIISIPIEDVIIVPIPTTTTTTTISPTTTTTTTITPTTTTTTTLPPTTTTTTTIPPTTTTTTTTIGSYTSIPTITTSLAVNTNQTTSVMGGNVTIVGGPMLIEKGICWSTGNTPTISDNKTVVEPIPYLGAFTCNPNLPSDTIIYYRAYAINQLGVGYGDIFQTKTFMVETINDIDGNLYGIIKIGKQKWFAENLKTTHLNDGGVIDYAWYGDDISNKNIYGGLYTGYAAIDKKTPPIGSHIPTIEEFSEIFYYFGKTGGILKESGFSHWKTPNIGAINSTNFSILPAGYKTTKGFGALTTYGYLLLSSMLDIYAYSLCFSYSINNFQIYPQYFENKFSIRCILDQNFNKSTVLTTISNKQSTSVDVTITISTGTTVVSRGICYDTYRGGLNYSFPTILNNVILNGSGEETFTVNVPLTPNTKYFIRGFVENPDGLSYGNVVEV